MVYRGEGRPQGAGSRCPLRSIRVQDTRAEAASADDAERGVAMAQVQNMRQKLLEQDQLQGNEKESLRKLRTQMKNLMRKKGACRSRAVSPPARSSVGRCV